MTTPQLPKDGNKTTPSVDIGTGDVNRLQKDVERRFDELVYIPCEVIDGDSCSNFKKPIYQEDTGGKRIVGYEVYPENDCACGMKKVKQELKTFLAREIALAEARGAKREREVLNAILSSGGPAAYTNWDEERRGNY